MTRRLTAGHGLLLVLLLLQVQYRMPHQQSTAIPYQLRIWRHALLAHTGRPYTPHIAVRFPGLDANRTCTMYMLLTQSPVTTQQFCLGPSHLVAKAQHK